MLKSELDERTRELLKGDKYANVIIKKCPKCGLWYSEDLGHECEAGTSEVEAALGKWIPVSERLPVNEESVITCDAHGYIVVSTFYASDRPNASTGSFYALDEYRVYPVAWMPLPKPYREEDNA